MFSTRLPSDLAANRLADAVARRRRDGNAFIDLTGSNPTRARFDYPQELLAPLADARGLVYDPHPFGIESARRAVALDYQRQGVDVPIERIVLTASTSEAYSLLFKLLCDAGDAVLVPRPSYPLFEHLTQMDLVATRPYALEYHGRWSIDVESLEAAITLRTRAVLIVSPNNPTGSFVTTPELDRLAAICARRQLALIADEVFVDFALEDEADRRAGRPLLREDVLSFSLGGFSKSIGLPQVKLGWIAIGGPAAAVRDALDRLEIVCDTYLSVSTPVQIAADELARRGSAVRSQILQRIRSNYQCIQEDVLRVPSCSVLRSDGGWSAVMQVPTYESEEELSLRLLERYDVLIHPGYFFDFSRESFLVASLLTPEDEFHEGVARILRHFACTARPS
ncbi:MAG TPA: pyridoxal phosphate-dependent aminotransferase [Vicinamibacterales bacterium]|jgi:hypothetical protein